LVACKEVIICLIIKIKKILILILTFLYGKNKMDKEILKRLSNIEEHIQKDKKIEFTFPDLDFIKNFADTAKQFPGKIIDSLMGHEDFKNVTENFQDVSSHGSDIVHVVFNNLTIIVGMITLIALSNLITNIAVLTSKKTLRYSVPVLVLILVAIVYYIQNPNINY